MIYIYTYFFENSCFPEYEAEGWCDDLIIASSCVLRPRHVRKRSLVADVVRGHGVCGKVAWGVSWDGMKPREFAGKRFEVRRREGRGISVHARYVGF